MEILHARVQNSGWSLYSICCSPSGCCPSREAIAPQGTAVGVDMSQPFRLFGDSSSITHGVAIEHYLSQHSVLYSNATSFGGRQSLEGSDRYCWWHRHWLKVRTATIQSLKGSNKHTLRHRRRIIPDHLQSLSLKGSYRYCLWHRHWQMTTATLTPSLKGSNRYTLRHRRRMIPIAFSSMSLKGSDRYYPVAQPRDLHTTNIF